MQKMKLAALAGHVPVGAEAPGSAERRTAFAFKSWRSSDEIAIGAIRDENRNMTAATYAAEVLAHFLTTWNGTDVSGLKREERRVLLSRSYAADVYTAWIELRRAALGNDFDMSLGCGACRKSFQYTVDLGSLEVSVPPKNVELSWPFQLRDGLERAGKTHRLLTLRPLLWSVYESIPDLLNIGYIKQAVMAGSIFGLDGVSSPVHFTPDSLDLTKMDIETLSAEVDQKQPGPDLTVDVTCPTPNCGVRVRRSVQWTYDSFFSVRSSSDGGAGSSSAKNSSGSATVSQGSPST